MQSKVFLNGNLIQEAMPHWTQHISLKQMLIGASKNMQGQFYNGLRFVLDELTIWKKTLTEQEIWNQYLDGLPIYDLSNKNIHALSKKRNELRTIH